MIQRIFCFLDDVIVLGYALMTPLHDAINNNHIEVALLLLRVCILLCDMYIFLKCCVKTICHMCFVTVWGRRQGA